VVHDEPKTAQAVAVRQTNFQYKSVLQQLAAKLIEIAMQQPSPSLVIPAVSFCGG